MENKWFKSYKERNEYIEKHVWRHIINWILCLVIPFTFTYIITCFKFISNYEDSEFYIALGILLFIIVIIISTIYVLLKECEKLINDLKNMRVLRDAEDY